MDDRIRRKNLVIPLLKTELSSSDLDTLPIKVRRIGETVGERPNKIPMLLLLVLVVGQWSSSVDIQTEWIRSEIMMLFLDGSLWHKRAGVSSNI